ncbi:MAG: (Fe-S)-binding protein [candidate division WOR-3 bacterium]
MNKKIYIFPTCIGNLIYKNLIKEIKKLLQKKEFEAQILNKPFCCGQVFYNTGNFKKAKKIGNLILKEWKNKEILFFSGSCLEYVLENLPLLTGKKNSFYAEEITNFLIKEKIIELPYNFHTSCHFKIFKNKKPEFLGCCGFGGVFSSIYLKTSEKILKAKYKEKKIISIEPGCSLHMKSKGFEIIHPLEKILWKKTEF